MWIVWSVSHKVQVLWMNDHQIPKNDSFHVKTSHPLSLDFECSKIQAIYDVNFKNDILSVKIGKKRKVFDSNFAS